MISFKVWKILREIQYQKKIFSGAPTNEKLTGISELNSKGYILRKIDISFILHFYLCCFGLGTL